MEKIELEDKPIFSVHLGNNFLVTPYLLKKFEQLSIKNILVIDSDNKSNGFNKLKDNENQSYEIISVEELLDHKIDINDNVYFIYCLSLFITPFDWEKEKLTFKKVFESYNSINSKWEIILLATSDSDLSEYLHDILNIADNNFSKLKIVVIRDGFSCYLSLSEDNELVKHLRPAIERNKIFIEGDGLLSFYPIYIPEMVDLLIEEIFIPKGEFQIRDLSGKQEWTSLNIAYAVREELFKQTGNLIEISFNKLFGQRSPSVKQLKSNMKNVYHIQSTLIYTNVRQGLSSTVNFLLNNLDLFHNVSSSAEKNKYNLLSNSNHLDKTKLFKEIHKKEDRNTGLIKEYKNEINKNKHGLNLSFQIFISFIFFLIVLFSNYFSKWYTTDKLLLNAWNQYEQGNINKALRSAETASYLADKSNIISNLLDTIMGEFGFETPALHDNELYLINKSTKIFKNSLFTYSLLNNFRSNFFSEEKNDQNFIIDQLFSAITKLQSDISKFRLFLQDTEIDYHKLFRTSKKLNILNDSVINIEELKNLLQVIDLLTGQGEKRYLVVFQNTSELRPTGGFIDAVVELEFKDARLIRFSTRDVNDLDAELKGRVSPPAAIRKYLEEKSWYLRDSNWDPDFPTTAEKIKWFYEKETGQNLNGVIAINDLFVKELIDILGPINISSMEKELTSNNFFEIYADSGEKKSFLGSKTKVSILKELFNTLLQAFEEADYFHLRLIGKMVLNHLYSGNLIVSVFDHQSNNVLNNLEWDGSLSSVNCPTINSSNVCIPLYLYLNEANLGVNYVNNNLFYEITLVGSLKDNKFKLTYTITNNSFDTNWPNGIYEYFLRLYTSKNVFLDELTINGEKINSANIEITSEHEKNVFGVYNQLPIQKKTVFEYIFHLEDSFISSQGVLKLHLQKQPGSKNAEAQLTLLGEGSLDDYLMINNQNENKLTELNWLFEKTKEMDIDFNFL
jgi:hypothetical protein